LGFSSETSAIMGRNHSLHISYCPKTSKPTALHKAWKSRRLLSITSKGVSRTRYSITNIPFSYNKRLHVSCQQGNELGVSSLVPIEAIAAVALPQLKPSELPSP